MKKWISGCLLLILPLMMKSQQLSQIGFQTGLNFNGAKVSNSSLSNKITLGFHAGAQARLSFSKNFGIKSMLLFEQRGFAYNNLTVEYPPDTIGRGNIDFRYNYIDLKILPMVSFNILPMTPLGQPREIYLYGGPFMGILTGNKYTTKFLDAVPSGYPTSVSSKSENVKNFNFGIALGFGTQIPIGQKLRANFDFRSEIGLSNIFKSGKTTLSSFSLSPGIVYVF